ncbi:hypothetical protein POL68_14230 [Stigmatella sp. ncwal1]|uniref:Lipoprotein n=1 Tax=Stigmatella ashevillensis TaxID=2995309 RepID=A0ABT5D982_9BACT|nr:hypothetical protein [Stigmatella ashevillena]MDC0709625.1 hypothetical protein [Stigmatella ashevillena]
MHRLSRFGLLRIMLVGLFPMACGNPESSLAEEPLGTSDAALCSGVSVSSLSIADGSSYGGDLAVFGSFAVSVFSNAVRLEYSVDGVLKAVDERPQPNGSWYFSGNGLTCGAHAFQVKAYPMIIDSNGNRTTCYDGGPRTVSRTFTQACPSASISCMRTSADQVTCTGSANGGTGSYTPFVQEELRPADHPESNYNTGWYPGGWSWTRYCPQAYSFPLDEIFVRFKVRDNSGMESSADFGWITCAAGTLGY